MGIRKDRNSSLAFIRMRRQQKLQRGKHTAQVSECRTFCRAQDPIYPPWLCPSIFLSAPIFVSNVHLPLIKHTLPLLPCVAQRGSRQHRASLRTDSLFVGPRHFFSLWAPSPPTYTQKWKIYFMTTLVYRCVKSRIHSLSHIHYDDIYSSSCFLNKWKLFF